MRIDFHQSLTAWPICIRLIDRTDFKTVQMWRERISTYSVKNEAINEMKHTHKHKLLEMRWNNSLVRMQFAAFPLNLITTWKTIIISKLLCLRLDKNQIWIYEIEEKQIETAFKQFKHFVFEMLKVWWKISNNKFLFDGFQTLHSFHRNAENSIEIEN